MPLGDEWAPWLIASVDKYLDAREKPLYVYVYGYGRRRRPSPREIRRKREADEFEYALPGGRVDARDHLVGHLNACRKASVD